MKATGQSTGAARVIESGSSVLGIEFGSTRIKATLIGPDSTPLASGSHEWTNVLKDGIWTYDLDDAWSGLADCLANLAGSVQDSYGIPLTTVGAAGISGMMHGYLALDKNDNLLVPFRTWRNNTTGQAAKELTDLFGYRIPQRWSVAHLYQAILDGESHVTDIARITTLAGYVHWRLTGEFVVGTCEASGMFPVDSETGDYHSEMLQQFDELLLPRGYSWSVRDLLPKIVPAGVVAGTLSEEGAVLMDSGGSFASGVPFCAPEGDAGTGMVATNSVRPRTGNVSAGTSVFAMLVVENRPAKVHDEIDLMLTPDGQWVAMAHSNNCTSDLDAWMALLAQAMAVMGGGVSKSELMEKLIPLALEAEPDAGGLLNINYVSGEHVTGFSEGRPLFLRHPDARFTLENFMRAHLYSALAGLRVGMEILTLDEGVQVDEIRGHGGFFKSGEVAQRIMAAATRTPVTVLETAGEGGPWGMALLAAYMVRGQQNESLASYLDSVFSGTATATVQPSAEDVDGFSRYFERFKNALPVEAAAVKNFQ